jgi:hypothetical protein
MVCIAPGAFSMHLKQVRLCVEYPLGAFEVKKIARMILKLKSIFKGEYKSK